MAKGGGVEKAIMVQKLKERVKEATLLYEKHVKDLEADHYGEFVAIAHDGRIIIGKNDIEVLKKAIKDFGKGKFAFRRIGFRTMGKWRYLLGR
ncbi:MAG: hypothetical protein QMD22_11805 [archaeon]|nr:hypothetical protein [archaeon]